MKHFSHSFARFLKTFGTGGVLILLWLGLPFSSYAAQDYVVLGVEGIWVREATTVVSGDVGANMASTGPWLASNQEVTFGQHVVVQDPTSRVMGDTMRLKTGSQVYDVFVNTLRGPGQILGTVTTPVSLPLVSALPPVPAVTPGTQNFNVPPGGTLTLDAGNYGLLKARPNATVTLTGGLYHFREWNIRSGAKVYAAASVEIRIQDHLNGRDGIIVGPAPSATTLTAADVVIYGVGINGTTGAIDATPEAARFGVGSTVRANVYAPNGLLRVWENSTATGAFLGKWVRIGKNSTVTLEDGFGLGAGGGNTPPLADAGPDQLARVNDTVTLDGSASSDVDGDVLTFAWTLVSQPPTSTATLSDPAVVLPRITLDQPGDYVVELIVNDGKDDSDLDTIIISTGNVAPVAHAGLDQTVPVSQQAFLDGTGSTDANGETLSYQWTLESQPASSTAVLNNPTSPTPAFTVDQVGTYTVSLVVSDGALSSEPDHVIIDTTNSTPVAVAGPDQAVSAGVTITLDGAGSNDEDGDPLTYQWAQTVIPVGSTATLSDQTVVAPTFTPDVDGVYVFQLVVHDGTTMSAPDTTVLHVGNTTPIADAGLDQTVLVQTLVTLDGAGSHDAEGDPLTYQWTLQSQPAGSTATLLNPTFAQPTFIPDVPGTYVGQVVVSDGIDPSLPDTVAITAQATPPPGMPNLIISSPAAGAVMAFSPITVTGLVSDPAATVTVNGIAAAVTGGVFVADGVILQEGANTLTVSGTDDQGNTNSVNVDVTLSSSSTTHLDPLWGPVEWVKQTSDEEVFTASFADCEPSAQYELVLINGTTGGANRVDQGVVLLNGLEVVSAQDFTAVHAQITQPITVQATNTLEFRLQGPIGAQVQAYVVCTANCLSVSIDAPVANVTINHPTMVVNGTISSSSPSPVGVVVNQQAAKVFGNTYAVDQVPVREGTGTLGPTTVVAQATNACGLRASTSLQVQTTEVPSDQVQLRVSSDRDIAPSEVTLRGSPDLEHPVTLIAWDHQGDGTIDAQGPDLLEQTVTFTQPGLYLPNVIVTDDQGGTFTASAVVLVQDAAAFEAQLNAQWSGVLDALAQGEIDQALTQILTRKREVMQHDWTVLKDHLSELATTFNVPLQLTDGRGARVVLHSATPITMGTVQFPLEVEFVLDTDGHWRIKNY